MATLFITDMDGTLLGADSLVSAESAAIISDLTRRGALISVATARTPATVEPLMHATLTTPPAIVLTGGALWDREKHRFISPHTLSEEKGLELTRRFKEHDVEPFVYTLTDDGGEACMRVDHAEGMSDIEDEFYRQRNNLALKRFVFGAERFPRGSRVLLLLGIGPTDRIMALADELKKDAGVAVSAYPDPMHEGISLIEVFTTGISKAAAVLQLKEMTGAERVVVYGDNLNDLPMFAVADESVAVENALAQVREAATRVIGPNTESSVAKDMRRVFEMES